MRTADTSVQVNILGENKMGMGGDNCQAKLRLNFSLAMEVGQKFALREGGKTIAAGIVTKCLPDEKDDDNVWGKNKITKK